MTIVGTSAPYEQLTEQATSPPEVEAVYLYGYFNSIFSGNVQPETQAESFEKPYKLYVRFESNAISEDSRLYCRVCDIKRNYRGSSGMYQKDHIADFSISGNIIKASYSCDISSAELRARSHFFEFYDEYGRVLCVYELIPK